MADFKYGFRPSKLIVDGDRLWAVGGHDEGSYGLWTSADGHSWQAIPGVTGDEVNDIVRGDAGYVAVGCDWILPAGTDCGIPLVWFSPDGLNWQRATLPTARHIPLPGTMGEVSDVIQFRGEVIAVGYLQIAWHALPWP